MEYNLKILDKNSHLKEFVKQSNAEIEITNNPAFNYSLGRKMVCVSYGDMYIVKDNKLIIDDKMIFTSVKTYLKEDAYKLSKTSKKLILYLDISNSMRENHYRFVSIEDIEECFKRAMQLKNVEILKKQGRKKRIYDSRKNQYR